MKPLVSLDLESTGTNQATDAIISIGFEGGEHGSFYTVCNPWKPIPSDVEKLTGITNAAAGQHEPFSHYAKEIYETWLLPNNLLGFNINGFDVPLLWEELYRCGIEWDLSKTLIIDAGTIWKKLEERTLAAAVKKFLGRDHDGGHNAMEDAKVTREVYYVMLHQFPSLTSKTHEELSEFSKFDDRKNRLTMDGKIVQGPDGDPIYNFGKPKGVKVKDDPSFAEWIIGRDFPVNTKLWLERYLDDVVYKRSERQETLPI